MQVPKRLAAVGAALALAALGATGTATAATAVPITAHTKAASSAAGAPTGLTFKAETAGAVSASDLRPADTSPSFALGNTWTGLCMDLPNYGSVGVNTPLSQYGCNTSESGDNQDWHTVTTHSVDGRELFQFVNDKSNLCLDLPNYGSEPPGTQLYTYYCNTSNDNQEWYADDAFYNGIYIGTVFLNFKSSGSAIVDPRVGGQCLDVSGWASDGSDLAPNLPLTIYNCFDPSWANYGFDDHLWEKLGATS